MTRKSARHFKPQKAAHLLSPVISFDDSGEHVLRAFNMPCFDDVPVTEQPNHAIEADRFFEVEPVRVIVDRFNLNRRRDLDVPFFRDVLEIPFAIHQHLAQAQTDRDCRRFCHRSSLRMDFEITNRGWNLERDLA